MKRIIKERIEFEACELDAFDAVRRMLAILCDDIELESSTTKSNLYIDTEHLLEEMDKYFILYYQSRGEL